MKVSEQLEHKLFYIHDLTPADFFPEENDFYLGTDHRTPWKSGEEAIKKIIQDWQECHNKVAELFQARKNKDAKPLMVKGISLFIKLLFWSNEVPVDLSNLDGRLEMLVAKPVNIQDRLQFLMVRPTLHHSFIQLSELMIEQEKIYYKHQVMKKRVNR